MNQREEEQEEPRVKLKSSQLLLLTLLLLTEIQSDRTGTGDRTKPTSALTRSGLILLRQRERHIDLKQHLFIHFRNRNTVVFFFILLHLTKTMNLGCKQYFQSCKTSGALWVFFPVRADQFTVKFVEQEHTERIASFVKPPLSRCSHRQASPQHEQHLTCPLSRSLIYHHIGVASGKVRFTFCGVIKILTGKLSATSKQDCTGIKPPFLYPKLAYWYIEHCAKYLNNRFLQNKNGTFKRNIHIYDTLQSSNKNKAMKRNSNWI